MTANTELAARARAIPQAPESEHLTDAITAAMEAKDFDAVVALMHSLAVIDPERAEAILVMVDLAAYIAESEP